MEGLLALQMHAGMGEMTVQFKDIQLKKLTGCKEVTQEATCRSRRTPRRSTGRSRRRSDLKASRGTWEHA